MGGRGKIASREMREEGNQESLSYFKFQPSGKKKFQTEVSFFLFLQRNEKSNF